jgi:peptidyl-prolyl cis-trans isomerase B (cyclophilin B)
MYLIDKMRMEHPETGGLTAAQQHIYATYGGTPHLDGEYTVFGEVEQGLDVVEKIQATPTTPSNRPLDDIAVKMTLVQ